MNSQELRQRIIDSRGEVKDPRQFAHGLANYISPMLGFLNAGILGAYGPALGVDNVNELKTVAQTLREELRSQLSEKDWNTYFNSQE